jgi:glutamate racemase
MKENNKVPIGVFDSGYGGLTVLAEIQKTLPEYDLLYLGDNARSPYGTRSFDVVYEYTLEAVKELFSRGCELVVLACNTASAKALRTIQQKDLPLMDSSKRVLGVIRPSTESIPEFSKTGHVGILATEGTVRSLSYPIEISKYCSETIVTQHACPIWVPLIENDLYETIPGRMFIKEDVHALLEKDSLIDTIILACTHYPILKEYIESVVPKGVQVIPQGPLIADKLEDYLKRHPELEVKCSKGGTIEFLTSETTSDFNEKATRFLGYPVKSNHIKLG